MLSYCNLHANLRPYQRGLNADRTFRGEFARIVSEMKTSDPEQFFSYFRMDHESFDKILELFGNFGPNISK